MPKAVEGKCELTSPGNHFHQMCSALKEVTDGGIGDINLGRRVTMDDRPYSEREYRTVVIAGRFKKDQLILLYCPFCGSDIQTTYPSNGVQNKSVEGV